MLCIQCLNDEWHYGNGQPLLRTIVMHQNCKKSVYMFGGMSGVWNHGGTLFLNISTVFQNDSV